MIQNCVAFPRQPVKVYQEKKYNIFMTCGPCWPHIALDFCGHRGGKRKADSTWACGESQESKSKTLQLDLIVNTTKQEQETYYS